MPGRQTKLSWPLKKGRKKKKASTALKVKRLENFVYKTIENKQMDYFADNIAISTGGFNSAGWMLLSAGPEDGGEPVSGGAGARIGNSVTLMRQQFKCILRIPTTLVASDLNNIVRVLCVEDLDPVTGAGTSGASDLQLTDVLRHGDYATQGHAVFCSQYTTKHQSGKKYKVHYDRCFKINRNDPSVYRQFTINLKYGSKTSPGKVVNFKDETAGFPTDHKIHILAISDSNVVDHPFLSMSVRSTYKDA